MKEIVQPLRNSKIDRLRQVESPIESWMKRSGERHNELAWKLSCSYQTFTCKMKRAAWISGVRKDHTETAYVARILDKPWILWQNPVWILSPISAFGCRAAHTKT